MLFYIHRLESSWLRMERSLNILIISCSTTALNIIKVLCHAHAMPMPITPEQCGWTFEVGGKSFIRQPDGLNGWMDFGLYLHPSIRTPFRCPKINQSQRMNRSPSVAGVPPTWPCYRNHTVSFWPIIDSCHPHHVLWRGCVKFNK